jgi:hypothetical protein
MNNVTRYADRKLFLYGKSIKFIDIIEIIKAGEAVKIRQHGGGDTDITQRVILDAAIKHLDIQLDDIVELVMKSKLKGETHEQINNV